MPAPLTPDHRARSIPDLDGLDLEVLAHELADRAGARLRSIHPDAPVHLLAALAESFLRPLAHETVLRAAYFRSLEHSRMQLAEEGETLDDLDLPLPAYVRAAHRAIGAANLTTRFLRAMAQPAPGEPPSDSLLPGPVAEPVA